MKDYSMQSLVRLARRFKNTKREYLLINPLQGKHLPVSPGEALAMMDALGKKIALAQPGTDLVIGFAETATAVAAGAAAGLGHPCRYIHTTREPSTGAVLEFREEHSHAVEQRLRLSKLRQWIDEATAIALVDDELSTGRTMINAMRKLCEACPSIRQKPVVVASVISRLSPESMSDLANLRLTSASLAHAAMEIDIEALRRFSIEAAQMPVSEGLEYREEPFPVRDMNARDGVPVPVWTEALASASDSLLGRLGEGLRGKRVAVLGTEEYMMPGLVFGARLEATDPTCRVRFHATTRSPIGICPDALYPIRAGWRLRSFYDSGRVTYIYNLEPCDVAVVLTDSPDTQAVRAAMADLTGALRTVGCGQVWLIREGRHVQHL